MELLIANFPYLIQGRLIFIRPIYRSEITDRYLEWLHDPKINRFLDARYSTHTAESTIAYINGLRSRPGCDFFAIFASCNGRHIGNITITEFNSHGNGVATYGLMIGDENALQMGFGGEASLLIVDTLFKQQEIRRLQERVYSSNRMAWSTLESLGFVKEGTLREAVLLEPNGEFNDVFMYGLLRDEWMARRSRFLPILKHVKVRELANTAWEVNCKIPAY
jgi:RimJ/RimL family protein N-acetyltransferase